MLIKWIGGYPVQVEEKEEYSRGTYSNKLDSSHLYQEYRKVGSNQSMDNKYYAVEVLAKAITMTAAFVCAAIMGSPSLFGWTLVVTVLIF